MVSVATWLRNEIFSVDVAGFGELDGVGEQVDQDLAQPLAVGRDDLRHGFRPDVVEGEALGLRLRPEHLDDVGEELVEVDLVALELQAAGLDLGDFEQAVDEAGEMLGAPPDDVDAALLFGRNRGVALQNLGVAEDRVERRPEFVAQADQIAALGEVGGLGHLLGLLQRRVGAAVGLDLAQEQRRLARRFLLRHAAALVRQHQEPGEDAGDDQEDEEGRPQRAGDGIGIGRRRRGHLEIDQQQDGADQRHEHGEQAEILHDARADARRQRGRQQRVDHCGRLRLQPRLRLAEVVAARIERAAQRADRPRIGRAIGGVLGLEFEVADRAADFAQRLPIRPRLARQVVLALGRPGDRRRGDEGHDHAR